MIPWVSDLTLPLHASIYISYFSENKLLQDRNLGQYIKLDPINDVYCPFIGWTQSKASVPSYITLRATMPAVVIKWGSLLFVNLIF